MSGPGARRRPLPGVADRRFRHPATRRLAVLQLRGGGGRRADARHARDSRRRPPLQHAAPDPGVPRAPAIFDRPKLDALAARHMARLPVARLAEMAAEQMIEAGLLNRDVSPEVMQWLGRLALLYADRLPRMRQLQEESAFLFEFEAQKSLAGPEVRETLSDPKSRRAGESAVARLGEEAPTAP